MDKISKYYHHIKHYKKQNKSRKTIYAILVLTLFFATLELLGGIFSGSLALIGDSFHMFSDVIALIGSAVAIHFAAKKPSDKFTFGYLRLEIIIAFVNGLVLMFIPFYLAYEAINRFFNPVEIQLFTMSSISFLGLIFNIVTTWLLYNSMKSEYNLNIQSAMWHFLGDLLNSIALIVSSVLIYLSSAYVIDIIMSLIVCFVLFLGGYRISKKSFLILMDQAPISTRKLREEIERIASVENIHDLHVWSSNDEEHNAIMHVLLKDYNENSYQIIEEIKTILATKFNIYHSFIVIENLKYNKH